MPTRHSARGAVAPSGPDCSFPSVAGRSLRSLGYAHTRAAQSRRPGLIVHFPQSPGAHSVRLATRIRARRSRAVRSAPQPGPYDGRRRAGCRACESPDHGAVEGVGGVRQHRVMQNETPKTTTAATFGRSSIERLPPELREAVDAAIADGATIDEIADLIRGEGGACSRSAVGRYTKNVRDLIRQQQETDRGIEMWVRALGERAQGRAGLILIETLRTMTLSTMADLSGREEPVSTAELARLALVLKRIEGTDKLRLAREQAAAKAARAAAGAGQAPGQAPPRKGLSPETVDLIDEAVVGFRFRPRPPVTSVPTDPWAPAESRESHLIPLNPGESRPENVPGVSSSISLNGGRSLRSLAYAPFGAARSRALRTCGPAAVRNSPPKARGAPATSWPDLPGLVPGIRPSIGPRTREEAWRREMPGTSPGMTRRVGRSDGSHPQGRRRPQPALPLHPLGGALVRTRTGSVERDRASVLIERFPCLCTTLPFRHGRACPGHPYGHAPVKRPGGGRFPDTRIPGTSPGKSGHDEEGGPVGWIASPRTQTATACSPSPPTISYPSGAGQEVNHFPQTPGAHSVRLASRIRARRGRAVRAASQPGSRQWRTPRRVPREAFVIKESGPQARSARLRAAPNGA